MNKTGSLALAAGVTLGMSGTILAQQIESADDVRAVVAEYNADAEGRTSLLSGNNAGHNGSGFYLQGDGYDLSIGGQLQFRYNANFRDNSNPDDFEHGFNLRRTRLTFDGTVADDWNFHLQYNFGNDVGGGAGVLEDAVVSYDWGNGWSAGFGQFKANFSRDYSVDGRHTLAVERTIIDSIFNGGRTQGVMLNMDEEDYRFMVQFNDGIRSANADFNSAAEADFGFLGRFEYKVMGSWSQFDDYTAEQGGDEGLLLGAGFQVQQSRNTGMGTDIDTDLFLYTFDASYEGDGWNAAAGFYGAYTQSRSAAPDVEANDFGLFVQGGWRFDEQWEAFGRWESLFLDDGDRPSLMEDTHHWLTFGVNHYYAGHAAKATADVVVALEKSASDLATFLPGANTRNVGLLGDMEEGEFALRFQFQLLF